MNERIVMSSDHRDHHGDVMTKQALESAAKIINGKRKVRWSIEHKRDLPPLGRITNAMVEKIDGHYYLTAEQIKYDKYEVVEWDSNLIKASFDSDSSPFNEPDFEVPRHLELQIDRNNFASVKEFEKYVETLEDGELELTTGEFSRKALINDPEIILKIAEYYLVYKLLKPTIDKSTERISKGVSKKIANETEKLFDLIRKSIKEMITRAIPRNRPVNYIIKIAGIPEIELFARIKDPEILIRALKEKKLVRLRKKISELENKIVFEKIQFTLTKKGKWKFNFLLTENGETIGRRVSFKKRDKKLELVTKATENKNK